MAGARFGVEVVTPERSIVSGAAVSVVLRTSTGWLTVLDGHTPLIGAVVPCEVRVEQEEGVVRLVVHGGFVEVDTSPGAAAGLAEGDGPFPGLSTKVTLLAGVAERADEVDVERAERAREEAQTRLSELRGATGATQSADAEGSGPGAEDLEYRATEAALVRAELRLSVARATAS
jgi:F-type H+-transporting ATPase subunit epsilon